MFWIIEKLSLIGGVISGICILLMAGLILLEVIFRSITGISILICEEYSAYLLVVFGSMALAYTFKSEGHIRVDLILSRLSPRKSLMVNLLCTAIGFLVFLYMVFQSWGQFYGSWLSGESSMYFSKTSLWVPQIFIFLGIALMVLQLLSAMAKLYQDLVKTNIKGADKGKLSNRDGLVQKEI
jgi:TRAP-type C4-dicarboxylate transport system permease small subunit